MYMKKDIKSRSKYSSEISDEQISEYIVLEISCTVSHKKFNKRTHITYISRIYIVRLFLPTVSDGRAKNEMIKIYPRQCRIAIFISYSFISLTTYLSLLFISLASVVFGDKYHLQVEAVNLPPRYHPHLNAFVFV